ncbi:hypothetical protein VUR80DRAFT_2901 [Thermomyces stellatus]
MATSVSKRQQARNERALHELISRVPGNDTCADCAAGNPAWASWSLGIFLCMRCASIHRKLGTHISKVKSLSMDAWSNEQVENMRKVGNIASNKIYNPKGKKPPVPIDADEADSAMERFIRAKYVTLSLNGTKKYSAGASLSDNETPPPLPPKTGKFGLRSASSLFPLSSKSKKQAAAAAAAAANNLPTPKDAPRSPSPGLTNKPSKVFGARLEYDDGDTENKLARLRDMGFTDHSRNVAILKGVNGNFERAVETLVRLGEGSAKSPSSLVSPRDSSLRATRSLTPLSTRPATNGSEAPVSPSTSSTNPFDMLTPQPQTAQSTGTLQNKNPYATSTNPFGAPGSAHSDGLSQSFQNMSLAPPQSQPQPLFPNHTGGIPSQPTGYHQSSVPTPPVPPMPFDANQTYPQPQMVSRQQQQQNGYASVSPQSTPGLGHNPFFPNQNQQQPLTVNTATSPQQQYANNPFARSPTRIQSPVLGQIPEQSQYVAASPASHPTNPWYTPPQPQQPSQRPSKASILALYNYPHLAPQPQPQPAQEQEPAETAPTPSTGSEQQPRSASTPLTGTKNPFFVSNGTTSPPPRTTDSFGNSVGQSNRDSVALGLDMASWSNSGRHSPDAFASLSARHG